ncbi:hypothetical protein CWI37_0083p0010 [Hamiltosporidium tvaerminnensis]|uniref:Uncharacterized protein n=1 Tax=Hamiltosporidium tvaerminnensis TaxID=1176355 RepID=A0A4Q9LAL5_9MICR|nr:hypothetical protein CWI37_0083p0010 [Hamiltosporidium tvaerminnensis]
MWYVIYIQLIFLWNFLKSSGIYPTHTGQRRCDIPPLYPPFNGFNQQTRVFPTHFGLNQQFLPVHPFIPNGAQGYQDPSYGSPHYPFQMVFSQTGCVGAPPYDPNPASIRMNHVRYYENFPPSGTNTYIPPKITHSKKQMKNEKPAVSKKHNTNVRKEKSRKITIQEIHKYTVTNENNKCLLEVDSKEVCDIIKSVYEGTYSQELKHYYPIIQKKPKITFNMRWCANEIRNITEGINNAINNLSEEIENFSDLFETFKSYAYSIFYTKNNYPMIYLKPIFLIIPIWLEDKIEMDLFEKKNIFYISWCLSLIRALMEHNKIPFELIDPNFEEMQLEFSKQFENKSARIYAHFNYISEFVEKIFVMNNNSEDLFYIFSRVSGVGFLAQNCDIVFSEEFTSAKMPSIIFDIFILLSEESLKTIKELIMGYESGKEIQKHPRLKFAKYMKINLNACNYDRNNNIRTLYFDVARCYEKIFSNKNFVDIFANSIDRTYFSTWLAENISNLESKISEKKFPQFVDILGFIEACSVLLNYISKVVLCPNLVPAQYKDILARKLTKCLGKQYF